VLLDTGEMGMHLQLRLKDNTKARAQTVHTVDKGLEDNCDRTEVKVNLPKLNLMEKC